MNRLGCGIEGLRSISARVDLILSDMPSGETQAEFDEKPDLPAFWRSAWAHHNAMIVLMASNIRFAGELVASEPKAFKYDLVWHKSVAGGFLNAGHRPLRAHEFVLVFSRRRPVYNPQMREGLKPIHYNKRRTNTGENYGSAGAGASRAGARNRYPQSVLNFASLGTRDKTRIHPQQKPVDLLRWLIRTFSDPGATIVDPFAGSGSTGIAAKAEGRFFIGFDSNPRFAESATRPLVDPKEEP